MFEIKKMMIEFNHTHRISTVIISEVLLQFKINGLN